MAQGGIRDFHHPYPPYDIQTDLMNAIYECIDSGKVGIFESPTGTAGSDVDPFRAQPGDGQPAKLDDEPEPYWVQDHARLQQSKAKDEQKAVFEQQLRQVRARELRQKQAYENGEPPKKRAKHAQTQIPTDAKDDSYFELENYESETEKKAQNPATTASDQGVSSASLKLMEQLGLVFKPSDEENSELQDEVKVFYCSRTHSQLTQFVQEVRRVKLPVPSWAVNVANDTQDGMTEDVFIKHLPLGSRKNLCINPKVNKLGATSAINERCLELQQPRTPKDHRCTFLPSKENQTLVNDFRNHTLASIRDIEDVGALGKKLGVCPYYASRSTLKPSEIVTLPYPLMLQKSARQALGLSLKGNVVIIDEAHNLMDTISSIHSVSVSHRQFKQCRASLGVYLEKFRNRLKGKNRVYIAQLVRLLDSLSTYLDGKRLTNDAADGVANMGEMMAGKAVDQINLYKLATYLQQSKLARKVEGYVQQEQKARIMGQHPKEVQPAPSSMPVLTHFQSFIQTLENPGAEGRFFYERGDDGDMSLKYMLLDPTHHFKEIVEEARAVILAGGTMSPIEDYACHLLAYVAPDRLMTWSCGHIIPKENLIAMPIPDAMDGTSFEFTYEKRNAPQLLNALGESLIDIACCVPDGLVVFFPSYAYLDRVVAQWKKVLTQASAAKDTIWARLSARKPLFQESKSTPVEDILGAYSISISAGRGGLLLSVINGKLSEGINFSDALGRAVIVVGLPFPNIQSAQWRAKLEYIEQSTSRSSGGNVAKGKEASRNFYENACMRAVNQSIGRAIRHRGDYASILLLDRRYAGGSGRIEGKLPGWIRQGLVKPIPEEGFGGVTTRLSAFFKAKEGGSVT